MGFLSRKKETKEHPAPIEKKSNTWTGSGNIFAPRSGYSTNWPIERVVEDALKKVTWVYRCVDAIASNAARVPVVMRKGDAWEGEIIEGHDLLHVLNQKANIGESSYVFRYRMSAQVLLSSRGVFIEIVRARGGKVNSLTLLPPDAVTPVTSKKDFVTKYKVEYTETNEQGEPQIVKYDLKPEDVIWIRKPHPFDPYCSLTALPSIGLSIETDNYAKIYNRNFLMNDGRPGGLVVIKGDALEEDKEELKARFRGNPATAGRITVITSNEGADFVDTAITPRDAQYSETRKLTKEEILMGFGVPESVLSNAAGRTFDNAETERVIFWDETMLPHLELIFRDLDILDNDETSYVGADLSRVDVLMRQDIKRRDYLRMEFEAGLISVDEYRDAIGLKPTGDERGKILWRLNTHLPYALTDGGDIPDVPGQVGDERSQTMFDRQEAAMSAQVQAAQATTQQPNQGRPTDSGAPKPTPDNPPKPREGDQRKPGAKPPKKGLDELELVSKQLEISEGFDRWEAVFASNMKRFLERQHRVLQEKLKGQKMRSLLTKRYKIIQSNGPITGSSELSLRTAVETVYDRNTWDKQLRDDFEPVISDIMKEFAEAVAADIDLESHQAKTLIEAHMNRMLKVNSKIKNELEAAITAGVMAEEKSELIAKRLDPLFESEVEEIVDQISKAEVMSAAAAGTYLGGLFAEKKHKIWINLDSDSVRPSHAALHGSKIGITDYFYLDGEKLLYPGDPTGGVEQVFNCRCGLDLE